MEIHRSYEGREHSLVKHALLKGYLEKLLFIKGMTGTREIAYVDCFAGPYRDETSELSTTSIAISLDILTKVQEALAVHRKYVSFRAIYVEEKKERYDRLKAYLESNSSAGVQAFPIHGDYAERTAEILQQCGKNSFAFFFIDPLGWTDVSITRLSALLRRRQAEFLITFMYDFLNRFISKADLRSQVSELLGELTDDDYQKIADLSPKEREDFIVHKYREQIIAAMGPEGAFPPRSYYAVVKDKDKDRTKYHLVYGTRHHKGIVEFAEQSEKADFIQHVVRIQIKKNADPNKSLFAAEEEAIHLENARVDIADVKNYWLRKLSNNAIFFDEIKLADMLEETGWLIGDLQTAFKDLLVEKKVENIDGSPRRTKHPVHFDKGERLRRCV